MKPAGRAREREREEELEQDEGLCRKYMSIQKGKKEERGNLVAFWP